MTSYEIKAFLNKIKEHKYKVFFMLALMSGTRRGELLGLKWDAVDWENNQIRIKRTFNIGRWYQPKTKASNRSIDLGPSMMMELRKWKLACPANKLNLIFPDEQGKPIEPTYLTREHFYPALKAAGAKQILFHDLRLTYASILIK